MVGVLPWCSCESSAIPHVAHEHAAPARAATGPVLIALNPYKLIHKDGLPIYHQKYIEAYSGKLLHETPPHTFAVAEDTYAAMLRNDQSQCVLITGESGAGKTECSKQIMQYLAAVSTQGRDAGTWAETERVKAALLESNPLLEAFGNAKTVRNNNSSRFGKYMSLLFDYDGVVRGGHVRNYLLEKSRITAQAEEERNFHIFYQLLTSAAAGVRSAPSTASLKLQGADAYRYLTNGPQTVPGHCDKEEFGEVVQAMTTLGIDAGQQGEIWRLLASILALGNITFTERPGAGGTGKPPGSEVDKTGASGDALAAVAFLLGIDAGRVEKALTTRKFGGQATGGRAGRKASIYDVLLDVPAATFTRDSLAKAAYEKLFNWVVGAVNRSIAVSSTGAAAGADSSSRCIGILDIYGFEIFTVNSFEQLCINYVNEKLQQLFISQTLKAEQDEYAREGIEWTPVTYFNNEVVCKLIDGKVGLLSLMDDKCAQKDATDEQLVGSFSSTLKGKNEHFDVPKRATATEFLIKHYAGDVQYDGQGFLEKNRDTLFTDLLLLMGSSKLPLVQELFTDTRSEEEKRKRPPTAGTQFKGQVSKLVKTLKAASPHYVRCIKPNASKTAINFDGELVQHQAKYLGLLENIRVRRAGFVFRQTLPRFLHRYKCLSSATFPQHPDVVQACKGLTMAETVTGIKGYVPSRRGVATGAGVAAGAGGGGAATPAAKGPQGDISADSPLLPAYIAGVRALLSDPSAVSIDGAALKEGTDFAIGKTKVFIRAPSTLFQLEAHRSKRIAELATKLEATVRAHQGYKRFQRFRAALVKVQALGRGHLAAVAYQATRAKTMRVQAFARGMRTRSSTEVQRARADLGLVKFFGKRRRRVSLGWDETVADHCGVADNAYLAGAIADVRKKAGLPAEGGTVRFSDMCIKLNKAFKAQRRMLVVTDTHVLNCMDDPKKPKVQRAVPLSEVGQVVMSPHVDSYILLMCPASHDYLYILQRKTQFVKVLREVWKADAAARHGAAPAGAAAAAAGAGGAAPQAQNLPVLAVHDMSFMNTKGGSRVGKDSRRIMWLSISPTDGRFAARAAGKPNDAEKLIAAGLAKPEKACGGGEGGWSEQPIAYHEQGAGLTLSVVAPQKKRKPLTESLRPEEFARIKAAGLL